MLYRATVVLQLDVASLGCSAVIGLPPFVSCDTSEDEESEVDDPANLGVSNSVMSCLYRDFACRCTYNIRVRNTLAAISIFPRV